ncbi:MAG: Fic family protein [Deltaproteobacteria bacterium]|nr:Fic family protein [Deltaproteobacteria bacterium]
MKVPQRPPSTERVQATLAALATKDPSVLAVRPEDRYLHWDELRRRSPPEGLDHETWWAVLKLGRAFTRSHVPLVDERGGAFGWSSTSGITEQLHAIDLWAGGHVGFAEPIVNRESQAQYYLSSLITEAITSSQLEGASTTREVAEEMLLSKRKPRDTGERMILNNYLTMKRIHELKTEPLTPALVFELHRLVTADTLERPDAAGRFRRADERIAVVDNDDQVLHDPPPAETLPARLRALCDFANGKTPNGFVHPALRAIVLHFWLAYDHPFVDGNGRTARALFYWSMLRSGYWLFEYVSISEVILRAPVKYGRAFLLTETDDNDLTYFVLYHLQVIRESLDNLKRYIAKKADDVRSLDGVLRLAADRFNHRQRELLSHALRHPTQVYTIAEHQARQGVVYQTARTDLLSLAEQGLLVQSTAGKKLVFRPVRDLEKRLRRLGDESS